MIFNLILSKTLTLSLSNNMLLSSTIQFSIFNFQFSIFIHSNSHQLILSLFNILLLHKLTKVFIYFYLKVLLVIL
jgi:hypothetical protein